MNEIAKGVIDIKQLNSLDNKELKSIMLSIGFSASDISGYVKLWLVPLIN